MLRSPKSSASLIPDEDMHMQTADKVEAELHKRFAEQVYVGMGNSHYLSALAHVVVRYVAEQLTAPCTYEARPLPQYLIPMASHVEGPAGAWCTKHGWDCPRAFEQSAVAPTKEG